MVATFLLSRVQETPPQVQKREAEEMDHEERTPQESLLQDFKRRSESTSPAASALEMEMEMGMEEFLMCRIRRSRRSRRRMKEEKPKGETTINSPTKQMREKKKHKKDSSSS